MRPKPTVLLLLVFLPMASPSHAVSVPWPALPGPPQGRSSCRRADSRAQDVVLPCLIRKVQLEDVSFYAEGGAHLGTFVRFSPNGRLLAIGTFLGHMKVLEIYAGRMLWETHVAEGMVKSIDFSPDGSRVYFGEQSPDGFVYAADSRSGEILWRFRLSDDLGSGPPPGKEDLYGIYRLPGCYRLKVLQNGDLLVLGIHAWGDYQQLARLNRLSRLYRLSPEGKLRWAFPRDGPMPLSLIYADSDPRGTRVAALTGPAGGNAPSHNQFSKGSLYVIHGESGDELGHHTFQPLDPYFKEVRFWQSISVGPQGKIASVGMRDGRTFLMDLDRVSVKQAFSFGAPVLISGVPVTAMATYTRMAPDGMAYFQTGNSTVQSANTMQHAVAPPGPHPLANTINAVRSDGQVQWRFRSGHEYQNFWISRDGRWVLTSVKRENQASGRDAGGMLFDTHRQGGGTAKLVFYHQVEGLTYFQADLAPDGSAFAIVEIPYRIPGTGLLKGTYQVHLVR